MKVPKLALAAAFLGAVGLAPGALSVAAPLDGEVVHLRLTASNPEADAVLHESPAEIRLWFSQTPELAVSMIRLQAGDERIELGELEAGDDNAIAAAVTAPLGNGDYTIVWRTSSGDGHPIRGEIAFSIAATR